MPYNYGGKETERPAYSGRAAHAASPVYVGAAAYAGTVLPLIMGAAPLVRDLLPLDAQRMVRNLVGGSEYAPKEKEQYRQGFDEDGFTEESINYRFRKAIEGGRMPGDVNRYRPAVERMSYADTMAAPAYAACEA